MEFPFLKDARVDKPAFTVVKGMDKMLTVEGAAGVPGIEAGDWVVKTAAGFGVNDAEGKKVMPVYSGSEKPDSAVTGGLTVIVGGGILVKTTKFVPGAYVVNQALTVKAGSKLPEAAGAADYVIGHVWSIADGVMEILLANR